MNNNSPLKLLDGCIFCDEIKELPNLLDPYFVLETETGYLSIAHNQYYKGYCLFISKNHTHELHLLDSNFKNKFLIDMSKMSELIYKTFKPNKINIELLGNSESHLHWHIIPRYKNDILPKIPAWNNPMFIGNKLRPDNIELELIKTKLKNQYELLKRKW